MGSQTTGYWAHSYNVVCSIPDQLSYHKGGLIKFLTQPFESKSDAECNIATFVTSHTLLRIIAFFNLIVGSCFLLHEYMRLYN